LRYWARFKRVENASCISLMILSLGLSHFRLIEASWIAVPVILLVAQGLDFLGYWKIDRDALLFCSIFGLRSTKIPLSSITSVAISTTGWPKTNVLQIKYQNSENRYGKNLYQLDLSRQSEFLEVLRPLVPQAEIEV